MIENFQILVDLNVKLTPGPQTRAGITTASPEVLCLFDFSKYKQFYGSSVAIQDYVSIFFRAVQNRFDTIRDPKITFTLVGLVIFGVSFFRSLPSIHLLLALME